MIASVERAAMKAIQIEAFGNRVEVVKAVDIPDGGAPAAGGPDHCRSQLAADLRGCARPNEERACAA